MPLRELVDYFNDRLRDEHGGGDDSEILSYHYGQVQANLGPLILDSLFQPVFAHRSPPTICGYRARLQAVGPEGEHVPPAIAFAMAERGGAIVPLDRLCRIVHMLNFLRLRTDESQLLHLHVDIRHILGVAREHGRYFETVLQRCGLGPERVVFVIQDSAITNDAVARIGEALRNYQARGYRIALEYDNAETGERRFARLQILRPDLIHLSRCVLTSAHSKQADLRRYRLLVRRLTDLGLATLQHGVENTHAALHAITAGVDYLSGSWSPPSADFPAPENKPVSGQSGDIPPPRPSLSLVFSKTYEWL